jgi:hypothetical protein
VPLVILTRLAGPRLPIGSSHFWSRPCAVVCGLLARYDPRQRLNALTERMHITDSGGLGAVSFGISGTLVGVVVLLVVLFGL